MLLQMNEITKRFGATVVLDGVSLVARAGDRIGIIGTNGTGKSTLLKIAAGRLSCDGGEVQYAPAAEVGYVPQTVDFRPGQTIAHLLAESRQRLAALEARMHALADQMATTSGTAQATLLDEPTNQLSLDVVEQLETALDSFPGAVLAVSHDRRFINRFRREQWRLIDGRIQHEPPGGRT